MAFTTIAVLGLGKVGRLAAELLTEAGFEVTGFDSRPISRRALLRSPGGPRRRSGASHGAGGPGGGAVLPALRIQQSRGVGCPRARAHYFDLTEDVATSRHIGALAESAKGVMAPQCGLAPGFVAIVGAYLAHEFERVRSIRLRVGALPQHPTGMLGYAFNWSPDGVVNEYLNDCEVIEEGVRKFVSAMEWLETVYIDGVRLEAFTTSGGIGTMCETYSGKVDNLDYKTLRYPGHAALMNFFFHELLMREDRAAAGRVLTYAKPPVDDDVVYLHVAAEGWANGLLGRKEFVRVYYPIEIGGKLRTAIAWTTAGSAAAVIEMVQSGALPGQGFLTQESVPLDTFLATRSGRFYAQDRRRRPPA